MLEDALRGPVLGVIIKRKLMNFFLEEDLKLIKKLVLG